MRAISVIIYMRYIRDLIPRIVLILLYSGILLTYSMNIFASTSIMTLESIKSELLTGTTTIRAKIASNLDLVVPKRVVWGAAKDIPCNDFDSISAINVTLLPPGQQTVLEISSSSCQYFYISVLEKTKAQNWKLIQTIPFRARNNTPHVDVESLIKEGEKEIVVSNNEVDSGTGIEQTNMTILKLFPSGLQVIFNEPIKVVFAIPNGINGNTDESEESQYTFIKPMDNSGPETGLKQILQKQVIRDHKTKITFWWLYTWVPEIERFEKTRTLH